MKTWIKEEKIPLLLTLVYLSMTIIIKMIILYNHTSTESIFFMHRLSIALIINTLIESAFIFVISSYLTQRNQLRAFNKTGIAYIIIVPIMTFCALLLLQMLNSSNFAFVSIHKWPKFSVISSFWFKVLMIVAAIYGLALPNILFFQWHKKSSKELASIRCFQCHQNILYSLIIFMMILAPLVIAYALLFVGFNIFIELALPIIGILIAITYLYYWHQPLLQKFNDPTKLLHNVQYFALVFILGYAALTTLLLSIIMLFPEVFLYITMAPFSGIAEKTGLIWTYIFGIACFIGLFYFSDDPRYKIFHALVFIITAVGVTLFLSIQGGSWGFYVALHMIGPALFVLSAFLLILGGYSKFILKQAMPSHRLNT